MDKVNKIVDKVDNLWKIIMETRKFSYKSRKKREKMECGKITLCKLKIHTLARKDFQAKMWIMWITIVQAGALLLAGYLRPP